MARTLFVVGLGTALLALAVAAGWIDTSRSGDTYTVRIVGNSSSGYAIAPGDKPVGDVYHVGFNGDIQWEFVNNTSPAEAVRFRLGDLEFLPNDCPVNWTNCEYFVPNLPPGNSTAVTATAKKEPDSYSFNISVGKHPEGQMRPIDPELQIDNNFAPNSIALLLALLSAGFFFAAWWTRRRRPPLAR